MNEDDRTPEDLQGAAEMQADFVREEKLLNNDVDFRTQIGRIELKMTVINMGLSVIESKLDKLLAAKKPKARKSKEPRYSKNFLDAWALYPKRLGSNSKSKAYSAFSARTSDAVWAGMHGSKFFTGIFDGIRAYAKFCEATGKTGTEFVMQAATFFGPDKHYENDWTVPVKAETLPKDNEQLESWAMNNGYRNPNVGEAFSSYRHYLKGQLRGKS